MEFFEKEWNSTKDNRSGKVLACAVKGFRTAYIAYEQVIDGVREVFAIVCLLDYRPHDFYNFGYKDMSEEMGPYNYDCPESILKLLTPTTYESALKWRKACQDRIDKRKSVKIPSGTVVEFAKPLYFGGRELKVFKWLKKNLFTYPEGISAAFRISDWKQREFKVLTQ